MTRTPGASLRDGNEDLELAMPPAGELWRRVARAASLRCPRCGGGPVRDGWFAVRGACGGCGGALARGEPDYFLGAMLFNLLLAEGAFAVVLVALLVARWPQVPWEALEVGAPLGMLAAPLLFHPVSKLLWLALDLSFRPDRAPR